MFGEVHGGGRNMRSAFHLVMEALFHPSQEICTWFTLPHFLWLVRVGASSGFRWVPGTEVSGDFCLVHLGRFHWQVLHPPDAVAWYRLCGPWEGGSWRGTSLHPALELHKGTQIVLSWFSPCEERQAGRSRHLEGWQEGAAVALAVLFTCWWGPGCQSTWASGQKKKEMVLNFHGTDPLKHRRKGATVRFSGFNPFDILDAQCWLSIWPGLIVSHLEGCCRAWESSSMEEIKLSRPSNPGMARVHIGAVVLSKVSRVRRCSHFFPKCVFFSRPSFLLGIRPDICKYLWPKCY